MQKKLIALAVAGAMVVPAVSMAADTEFYGKIRISAAAISNNDDTDGNDESAIQVNSHSSRVGFKGSEDLDNGMKAIFQVESQIDIDDTSEDDEGNVKSDGGKGDFSAKLRNTFVGLSGGFGTVVLGRHDTPYKMAAKKADIFADTHADYNSVIQLDNRINNVIAYVAPDMGNFGGAIAYVTSLSGDDLPDDNNDADTASVSLMVNFKAGDLKAYLAYESLGEIGVDGDDIEGLKLGVLYGMGGTNLALVWEELDVGGDDGDSSNIYVSAKHKVGGGWTAKLALGQVGEVGDADNGAFFFAIGAAKAMSKNTEVYALYTSMDNDDDANRKLKGGVANDDSGAGEAVSALAIGINHKFSSK